jgi:alpha-beta hydrolase superfamily lysophospholipase
MMERFIFTTHDGAQISAAKWIPDGEIKAVVQIVHGMNEYIERHAKTAEFLANNGYAVFGEDHRGHGLTAKDGKFGHFDNEFGYKKVIEDNYTLTKLIKNEFPGKKVFLLGHSMGSFISRNFVFEHGNEIDGLLLMGTGGLPLKNKIVNLTTLKVLAPFVKPDTKLPLVHKIGNADLNKAFRPGITGFEWLSTDQSVADAFLADPMCGNVNTYAFYKDLVTMMLEMEKPENIAKVPKKLPVFIFSGSMDPVGDFGRKVTQAYKDYMKAGLIDVTIRLYEGYRHELHNEPVRDELFKEILNWLEKRR